MPTRRKEITKSLKKDYNPNHMYSDAGTSHQVPNESSLNLKSTVKKQQFIGKEFSSQLSKIF
jgi:hypothetical protein